MKFHLFTLWFTSNIFLPLSILLLIVFVCIIRLPLPSFILSFMYTFNNLRLSLRILFLKATVVFCIVILKFFLIFCSSLRSFLVFFFCYNFPYLVDCISHFICPFITAFMQCSFLYYFIYLSLFHEFLVLLITFCCNDLFFAICLHFADGDNILACGLQHI